MKKTILTSTPSPEMIKAANDLVEASGSNDNTNLINSIIIDEVRKTASPKVTEMFDKLVKKESERSNIFVSQVYARHFSLEEMNKMISFYTSPIGKRYVKKIPGILEEIIEEQTKRLPIFLRKLRTRLDKID